MPSPEEDYRLNLWTKGECYRYYIEQRRLYCSYNQILDLWLLAPCCEDCAMSNPFLGDSIPNITPSTWALDILLELGPQKLEEIVRLLSEEPEFAFICKKCGTALRPWDSDSVYVTKYHIEEHYGIPLNTPGRKDPPMRIQKRIISLYERKCFRCGVAVRPLHIDHIQPRSKGGDAAFRNLQPLCIPCGEEKGDSEATEVEVFSTMYFGPYPSDSYEGLFW